MISSKLSHARDSWQNLVYTIRLLTKLSAAVVICSRQQREHHRGGVTNEDAGKP